MIQPINICATFETSLRLKKSGFPQGTIFSHFRMKGGKHGTYFTKEMKPWGLDLCAAPTWQEIAACLNDTRLDWLSDVDTVEKLAALWLEVHEKAEAS